jgi:hypothetical protein
MDAPLGVAVPAFHGVAADYKNRDYFGMQFSPALFLGQTRPK